MLQHFLRLFVTCTLKSGSTISFSCTNFEWGDSGNELVSYKCSGATKDVYINLDEVAAFTISRRYRPWYFFL